MIRSLISNVNEESTMIFTGTCPVITGASLTGDMLTLRMKSSL